MTELYLADEPMLINLDELEAMEREATPWPWTATNNERIGDDNEYWTISSNDGIICGDEGIWIPPSAGSNAGNARFIAAAREALPKLIALVRAQDKALKAAAEQAESMKVVVGAAAALAHAHIENEGEREAVMTHVRKIAAAIPGARSDQCGLPAPSGNALDLRAAVRMILDRYDELRADRVSAIEFEILRAAFAAHTAPPASSNLDAELVAAADAVVERWHSKDWKQPPTSEFINRLSAAVGAAKRAAQASAHPDGSSEARK